MTTLPGTYKEAVLPQGTIRYRDEGRGPTLVFIHGLLVNNLLWSDVIALLSGQFRCIAPDLPLGAHAHPLGDDVDLSPTGIAQLIADFLEELDLQDVTLVGNDTGGAFCQLVITQHPERIVRFVLTNCDAFENFLPPSLRPLSASARLFGTGFTDFFAWLLQARSARRVFTATVTYRHLEAAELDLFFDNFLHVPGARRDVTRVLQGISNRYTLEAARNFARFSRPVLIVWGKNDLFFPTRYAVRLQQAFPDADLRFVSHSRAFVALDQPERLANYIQEFVHERDGHVAHVRQGTGQQQ